MEGEKRVNGEREGEKKGRRGVCIARRTDCWREESCGDKEE